MLQLGEERVVVKEESGNIVKQYCVGLRPGNRTPGVGAEHKGSAHVAQ